jgi:hypothetical protein
MACSPDSGTSVHARARAQYQKSKAYSPHLSMSGLCVSPEALERLHQKYLLRMRHVDFRFLVREEYEAHGLTFAPLCAGIKMKHFDFKHLLGPGEHDEQELALREVWREERHWRYGNNEQVTNAEVVARDARRRMWVLADQAREVVGVFVIF